MKKVIKVLIADDLVIVRKGLRFMLENQDEFIAVISEASNGAEVLDKIYKDDFDIILMDIQMPKMDGIATIEKLRSKGDKIPVIVLSVHDDESIIKQVIDKGGNGYIMKDAGSEELVRSIQTVLSGEMYFGNAVTQILLGAGSSKTNRIGLDDKLTRRECEVLKLIAEEFSHDEIAQQLAISRRTVEGHKKNLTAKLNVKGSVGLVKYAMNNGYS